MSGWLCLMLQANIVLVTIKRKTCPPVHVSQAFLCAFFNVNFCWWKTAQHLHSINHWLEINSAVNFKHSERTVHEYVLIKSRQSLWERNQTNPLMKSCHCLYKGKLVREVTTVTLIFLYRWESFSSSKGRYPHIRAYSSTPMLQMSAWKSTEAL